MSRSCTWALMSACPISPAGIPYRWLVDPNARTLEAFKLRGCQGGLLASFVDDATVVAEPFDAVPFALDALWAD